MARIARSSQVCVHGCCLTETDIYLLVEVTGPTLGRFVQVLCARYGRWLNGWRGALGHVFQQRCRSVRLNGENVSAPESRTLIREVVRHLHRGARGVRRGEGRPLLLWSTRAAYERRERVPWLHTALVLRLFGSERRPARRGSISHEEFHPEQFESGDKTFLHWLQINQPEDEKRATLDEVIDAACVRLGVDRRSVLSASRARTLSLRGVDCSTGD